MAMPCESFSVHAKFAGEELIVMVPFFSEPENEIFAVEPGDIGYYPAARRSASSTATPSRSAR